MKGKREEGEGGQKKGKKGQGWEEGSTKGINQNSGGKEDEMIRMGAVGWRESGSATHDSTPNRQTQLQIES